MSDIQIGSWVMALRTCAKEEPARVIANVGEDKATIQFSDGRQWTCDSRSLRPAELTPLMRLALEAEFGPPTPVQRIKLLEEDIALIEEHMPLLDTMVAMYENSPAYEERVSNMKRLREERRAEIAEKLAEIDRLRAEIDQCRTPG